MKADLSLYTRLRRLKAQRTTGTGDASPPTVAGSGPEPAGTRTGSPYTEQGFCPAAAGGFALAGWRKLSDYVFTRSFSLPNPYPDHEQTPLFHTAKFPAPPELCFYDTETTGLSGGAGNVVFLLGLGRISPENLVVEQYFLADFPGEREFLTQIAPKLDPGHTYVSYNGSAFDRHVLRTRFIMHGMQNDLPHQLDLLFPVRRLWKTLIGSCSLHNVEEQVLRIRRTRDVPGAEVPLLYFDYLRSGDSGRLELVFEHNKQDVLSLIHLFFKLQMVFSLPGKARNLDAAALGALLLEQGHPQATGFLQKSFESGDAWCGRALSLSYKKQGKWGEAVNIWQALYSRYKSLFAGLELAKFWEHQKRDYPKALQITEELLARTPAAERARVRTGPDGPGRPTDPEYVYARAVLLHRAKRLRSKISRL